MEMELYLHIPFCVKKCDYCDFLSFRKSPREQDAYCEALIKEIKHTTLPQDAVVSSIFIGGGTPSAIDDEWIVCIMDTIKNRFVFTQDVEISMEANPGTLTMEKLNSYRRAGINRLSIGLQSADDQELRSLGRIHTFEEFLNNYQLARKAGFDNINIDLMTALPGQNLDSLCRTLKQVVMLRPEHISAYSLIVEPGTPFYERELNLPDEEEERRMYEETKIYLEEWDYHQYEISNFAQPGKECRHNIGYWKRTPYLGMGLGASSLMNEQRFSNTADMEEYLQYCEQPERLRKDVESLTKENQMEEFMFLGLRMTEGISETEFQSNFGVDIDAVYKEVLDKYLHMGLLARESGRIFLTREGVSVSNVVMSDFLL